MSFSYDPAKLNVELNRIRLEIFDTSPDDPLLLDEEIIQIQAEESSFFKRVAKCCQLIASKFSREVKVRIDGFSEDPSDLYKRYLGLYDKYSTMSSGSYPWAASVSKAEKDSYETNPDRVEPKIKLGIHDNA